MSGSLNPRWVLGILRDRGLPAPELRAIVSGVNALQPADVEKMRRVLADLARGGETAGDMEWVAQWSRELKGQAEETVAARRAPQVREERPARPHAVAHPLESSHHVYGTAAAMCVEVRHVGADQGERGSFTTVAFEFAPAIPDTQRGFAWGRKLIFRLGQRELPRVASVFAGYNQLVELEGHGPSHNKSLVIEDQGTHIFMKARQGKQTLAVQVTAGDLLDVSARVMHAVTQNVQGLQDQPLLLLLRRTGQMDSLSQQKEAEVRAA